MEVLAIYGELDHSRLPDADVITSAFKVSRKVSRPLRRRDAARHPSACHLLACGAEVPCPVPAVCQVIIRRGQHPCYLDNPPLFHQELLELVRRQETAHPHIGRDGPQGPTGMSSLLSKISSDSRHHRG